MPHFFQCLGPNFALNFAKGQGMERGERFGVEREGGQRIGTRSERNGEGAYEAERRNRRAAGTK